MDHKELAVIVKLIRQCLHFYLYHSETSFGAHHLLTLSQHVSILCQIKMKLLKSVSRNTYKLAPSCFPCLISRTDCIFYTDGCHALKSYFLIHILGGVWLKTAASGK